MKHKWPFILFWGVSIIIFLLIIFATLLPRNSRKQTNNQLVPTVTPLVINSQKQDAKKLLDSVENRQSLSNSDLLIRQKLTTGITPANDVVYQTKDFVIEYVQAPDDFEVEILTPNVNKAKQEVVNWFESQGISSGGICGLPLNFYLNPDAAAQLPESASFSRLPDGC